MGVEAVSPAPQARLGRDATTGLLAWLETAHQEWQDHMTAAAIERFERRLTEELGGLRGEMRECEAQLREERRDMAAALREEGRANTAALREEMRSGASSLRVELKDEMGSLRVDVADAVGKTRVDMMPWSFSLWVGHVVATAAIVGGMFRVFAL
jgi:hypothetical protein